MFEKEIIVDGRGHLVGRLASIVAHQLLCGQKVAVVRCEKLELSGSLFRNKLNYHEFLRKACNTNPRRHFKHYRAPSRMFWRSLRGMLPHKSPRGKAALARLRVFDGVPAPYDTRKRMVVPQALKVLRLKAHRNSCELGELASHVGWTKRDVVETLEAKRIERSAKYWDSKQKKLAAKAGVAKNAAVTKISAELAGYGF